MPFAKQGQTAVVLAGGGYLFRLAATADDHRKIQRLLHQTFVLEVRQDADSGTGSLVDKFHHKNRYVVALRQEKLCGLIALHDEPPFSTTEGLPGREAVERLCPRLLEARRLAVEPDERTGTVFAGLLWSTYQYARRGGYQFILMSGLLKRQTMYGRLGFRALGAPVRKGQADFVPMLLDLLEIPERISLDLARWERKNGVSRAGVATSVK